METKRGRLSLGPAVASVLLAAALAAPAPAQVTIRVSLADGGQQVTDDSGDWGLSITPDGRFVAFHSKRFLDEDFGLTGDPFNHVFVRDRQTGDVEVVSIPADGSEPTTHSNSRASISADGRFVAFESPAWEFFPSSPDGLIKVLVRDLQTDTTEHMTVDTGAGGPDGHSRYPDMSADARYVAFWSGATNLVTGDVNGFADVFVRDRQTPATELASVDTGGAQANGNCGYVYGGVAISADGRCVAFQSLATNLVAVDVNGFSDVFVRDRVNLTTEIVSVDSAGAQGNGDAGNTGTGGLAISADGRFVAFASAATNLVLGDTNGVVDVFVRDRQNGTTERVSLDSSGAQGNGVSTPYKITADGRFVAFSSAASNLVPGDTNAASDAFLRDRQSGTTERLSVSSAGVQGNSSSFTPFITDDGRFVVFSSSASNLVPGDTNADRDVFVRDRAHPPFPDLCHPGIGGIQACPCGNPPSAAGRGCNNSAGTGGAMLSISGGEYLSSDSLVLTTSGEKPVALSLVVQGTLSTPGGMVYGQGIRCVAGVLRRLYVKSASGGSITAPNHAAGEASVHSRSAALGHPISPGTTRRYFVYYRDPVVLGGCPSSSTFNATQMRAVTWQH